MTRAGLRHLRLPAERLRDRGDEGARRGGGLGDAVVVNSCAVTAEAVRQARQQIRRLRRDNPEARLIVTGCAAQTEPATFAAMPEVDVVLGNAEKLRPAPGRGSPAGRGAARVAVGDIMAERRPRGAADRRARHPGARLRPGAERLRPPLHLLHHPLRPRQLAQRAGGDRGRAGRAAGRPRLQRGGADRRRPDELGRRPRGRAAARRPGRAAPARVPGPAAAPALLDRLGRGRPAAGRGDRGRAAADAAPAPVAAGRRRPDPEADEAAAPARRRHRLLRRGAGGAAGDRASAPTSSPASRPRPRRCSRTRCGSSRNAG